MHAAPSVRVSLGGSAGWVVFVSLCAGLAAANLVAWLLLWREAGWGAAVLTGLAVAALAAWRMRRVHAVSDLNWDGSQWLWQGLTGEVHVALDLDAWMLLCFDPVHGKRCWIAASRRSARGPWHALRAALHARPPAEPLAW